MMNSNNNVSLEWKYQSVRTGIGLQWQTETDRQTDRQAGRQTDSQSVSQTVSQSVSQTDRQLKFVD